MAFQLQAFDFNAIAAVTEQLGKTGAFADVQFATYNNLGHDGDGRLVIRLAGADERKVKEQLIVLAAFEGESFQAMRRQFYAEAWTKGQDAKPADCKSVNGKTPDADSPKPQSSDCKSCPNSAKGASKCSYRKDFVVYLVNIDPTTGNAVIDTGTAFTWQASSLSLFPEMDKATNSAGIMPMVQLLAKAYATIEGVVFNLGFHQGSKAPVLAVAGMLPMPQVLEVIEAAKQPEVQALLTARAERVNKTATVALPAPTRPKAIAMDTPRAAAAAAITRTARPAPPAEVVVPEAELYVAPAPAPAPAPTPTPFEALVAVAPAAPVESEEDREEREMMEALAAKRAARAAAANQPAAAKVIESTATVRTMPAAVAPPVSAAPAVAAPAPAAALAPAGNRMAALSSFGAAKAARG